MNTTGVNSGRRRFLTAATAAVGAVGVGFLAVPFLSSMQPSARAQAAGAPVEVDISKLEEGQRVIVEWRGKPVWIVRRSEKNIKDLATLDGELRDPHSDVPQQPSYTKNEHRSLKKELLIVIGICTHLGCSPSYVRETDPHNLRADWKGGFFCPCHGSLFDLAGRVYKGVPAPTNLVVPPHKFLSNTQLLVGVDSDAA